MAAGGWEALLDLRVEAGAKAARLTGALRAAVTDGRLTAGTRLPSTRDLAADLGVSRGAVVAAYEQLGAEGRLTARRGGGTTVAAGGAAGHETRPIGPAEPAQQPTALRPGVPDLSMFPRAVWRRAYDEALTAAL